MNRCDICKKLCDINWDEEGPFSKCCDGTVVNDDLSPLTDAQLDLLADEAAQSACADMGEAGMNGHQIAVGIRR